MSSTGERETLCPSEAAWLYYVDGEGAADIRDERARHLSHCADCQNTVKRLTELSALADGALLSEPIPASAPATRRRRPAYPALAAAAALAGVVLAVSAPARHALADAFTVFQPQKIEAVPISTGTLQTLASRLTDNGRVSLDTFGSAHLVTKSASYSTPSSSVNQKTGLPTLWPAALGAAQATVHPAEAAAFTLNIPRINMWLKSEGATTLFPTSLEGETFTINVPTIAAIKAQVPGGYDALVEMQTPSLAVPSGVPVNQVRAAILNLPFLPQNFRTALSAIGNWRNTAVLPLPGNPVNTTFLGHPAVVEPTPDGSHVSVIWIQNGSVIVFTEYRAAGLTPAAFQTDAAHLFS